MAGAGGSTHAPSESWGYPGAEEEESTFSAPGALWSVSLKALEATGSGYCAPRLLMCSLLILILASSSYLYHST